MELEGTLVKFVEPVLVILLTLLLIGLKRFAAWLITKAELKQAEQDALQAILEGMALAQKEVVRIAKDASEDGRLTQDEIIKAEEIAIAHAKNIATGPAKELLLSWSKERLSSLIKQLLSKYKVSA